MNFCIYFLKPFPLLYYCISYVYFSLSISELFLWCCCFSGYPFFVLCFHHNLKQRTISGLSISINPHFILFPLCSSYAMLLQYITLYQIILLLFNILFSFIFSLKHPLKVCATGRLRLTLLIFKKLKNVCISKRKIMFDWQEYTQNKKLPLNQSTFIISTI